MSVIADFELVERIGLMTAGMMNSVHRNLRCGRIGNGDSTYFSTKVSRGKKILIFCISISSHSSNFAYAGVDEEHYRQVAGISEFSWVCIWILLLAPFCIDVG